MSDSGFDFELLTPGEVADRFRVDPKTVTRWVQNKKFDVTVDGVDYKAISTPGGHRRIPEPVVRAMLSGRV